MHRSIVPVAGLCLAGVAMSAAAQAPATKRHPAVCAEGVRVYTERASLPAQRDSVPIPPPPGGGVRVTNQEEADAAELAMRGRAGSAGATSVLVLTEMEDGPNGHQMRRTVSGFFIVADSVRAAGICKK